MHIRLFYRQSACLTVCRPTASKTCRQLRRRSSSPPRQSSFPPFFFIFFFPFPFPSLFSLLSYSFLSRLKTSGRDIAFTLPVRRAPSAVRRPEHNLRTVWPTVLRLGDMKGVGPGVRCETFGGCGQGHPRSFRGHGHISLTLDPTWTKFRP